MMKVDISLRENLFLPFPQMQSVNNVNSKSEESDVLTDMENLWEENPDCLNTLLNASNSDCDNVRLCDDVQDAAGNCGVTKLAPIDVTFGRGTTSAHPSYDGLTPPEVDSITVLDRFASRMQQSFPNASLVAELLSHDSEQYESAASDLPNFYTGSPTQTSPTQSSITEKTTRHTPQEPALSRNDLGFLEDSAMADIPRQTTIELQPIFDDKLQQANIIPWQTSTTNQPIQQQIPFDYDRIPKSFVTPPVSPEEDVGRKSPFFVMQTCHQTTLQDRSSPSVLCNGHSGPRPAFNLAQQYTISHHPQHCSNQRNERCETSKFGCILKKENVSEVVGSHNFLPKEEYPLRPPPLYQPKQRNAPMANAHEWNQFGQQYVPSFLQEKVSNFSIACSTSW